MLPSRFVNILVILAIYERNMALSSLCLRSDFVLTNVSVAYTNRAVLRMSRNAHLFFYNVGNCEFCMCAF